MIFYHLRDLGVGVLRPKLHASDTKYLLNFGIKNFITSLAGQAEIQSSKYILGSISSAAAVTAYSIPQNIVIKGAGIVSQVAQALFPLSASLLDADRVKKLKQTVYSLELLVLAGGLLAVFCSFTFGNEFLLWWLNDPEIVKIAHPILNVLSFYFLLTSLTPIPGVIIQSINKPEIPSFFAVLTTVLEIGAMLYLIPIYGSIGAAYAAVFSSSITVPSFLFVCNLYFEKEIKRIQSPVGTKSLQSHEQNT